MSKSTYPHSKFLPMLFIVTLFMQSLIHTVCETRSWGGGQEYGWDMLQHAFFSYIPTVMYYYQVGVTL